MSENKKLKKAQLSAMMALLGLDMGFMRDNRPIVMVNPNSEESKRKLEAAKIKRERKGKRN